MIFVDTSYLVALFDASDQLHNCVLAWSDVLHQRLLVSEYVLLEVVNNFSNPFDRPKAHAVVDFARTDANFDIVPCGTDLFQAGLALHRQRALLRRDPP